MSDKTLEMVREFHKKFGCALPDRVDIPDEPVHTALGIYFHHARRLAEQLKEASAEAGGSLLLIRLQLIQEELAELAASFISRNPVECLDALADLTYVTDGTYLSLGMGHLKVPAVAEVHRSNMTKLGRDGQPIVSPAGRVVKGPDYQPPNLAILLEGQ